MYQMILNFRAIEINYLIRIEKMERRGDQGSGADPLSQKLDFKN